VKIIDAKVLVSSPGRNFVTLRVFTDQGFVGLGDATLNGRELAVASYLQVHLIPCLIGRDPFQSEDIWQYFYRGAYWRRGPVAMTAIAAIDMALWDIKGKAFNTPVYNLLGGKSRDAVLVYGHANGRDIEETGDEVLALGEIFNSIWDAHVLITEQLIDYIRMTIVHSGGISHLKKIASLAELYHVRTGCHGATDLSPVSMAAALHFDMAINNFGVQEYMVHTRETDEVFPHAYSFRDGFLHPGDGPGFGVDYDESLAAKFPYQRAYLPVNRKEDGTLFNW
jgi:L-alanine-DL-glutamate epimerase-like enolase superfamily enzyme